MLALVWRKKRRVKSGHARTETEMRARFSCAKAIDSSALHFQRAFFLVNCVSGRDRGKTRNETAVSRNHPYELMYLFHGLRFRPIGHGLNFPGIFGADLLAVDDVSVRR